MTFMQKWNKFWFTRNMNSFDMLCIIVVSVLTSYSWFWFLSLLPLNMLSAYMETMVERQAND